MPIGLPGCEACPHVWLIQLLPSPNLSPERFALPTLSIPAQAQGTRGYQQLAPWSVGCNCRRWFLLHPSVFPAMTFT